MKKISWRRILKLSVFAITAIILGGTFAFHWLYTNALIYPGCSEQYLPLPDYYSYTEISLNTSDGLSLPGWYYPSFNGAAVIAAGGISGSLGIQNPPISSLLDAGYGVLQIGTRACANPPAKVGLGYHEIKDTRAALDYLLDQPEIDPQRIGIIGWSMGGANAIRSAARFPEISAVVAEGGYFNLGQDFLDSDIDPRPGLLRGGFLYSLVGIFWLRTGINPWDSSPVDDLPAISPRPVFLIYGEKEVDDGRGYVQFAAAKEPKQFWLVPNGTHGTNHIVAPEEYNRRIVQFFDETLLVK